MTTIRLSQPYASTGTAKLAGLPAYQVRVKELELLGADVTLTDPGPVGLLPTPRPHAAWLRQGEHLRLPSHGPSRGYQPQPALKYENHWQI